MLFTNRFSQALPAFLQSITVGGEADSGGTFDFGGSAGFRRFKDFRLIRDAKSRKPARTWANASARPPFSDYSVNHTCLHLSNRGSIQVEESDMVSITHVYIIPQRC
jgi:hypothetical protein